jgi:hypothetical protein
LRLIRLVLHQATHVIDALDAAVQSRDVIQINQSIGPIAIHPIQIGALKIERSIRGRLRDLGRERHDAVVNVSVTESIRGGKTQCQRQTEEDFLESHDAVRIRGKNDASKLRRFQRW